MSDYGPDDLQRDLNVSRETVERLEIHRKLLAEWSQNINLIGPKELEHYWQRHALDCAQLLKFAPDAKTWVDLGAGAGFPGIVIACALVGIPGVGVDLVEATGKKARFLEAVIQEAGLPAQVFNVRVEQFKVGPRPYDVVTARAFAPLPRLMDYAKPILDRGAQGLFHKGANVDAELAAAKSALNGGRSRYRADVLESLSDPRGRILRITKAA